jgi:hypothetical protein
VLLPAENIQAITGGWRESNWEFHNLYSSPDIISIIKRKMWVRNSMHGTEEEHKPEWKTPFGRARQRWEDNI